MITQAIELPCRRVSSHDARMACPATSNQPSLRTLRGGSIARPAAQRTRSRPPTPAISRHFSPTGDRTPRPRPCTARTTPAPAAAPAGQSSIAILCGFRLRHGHAGETMERFERERLVEHTQRVELLLPRDARRDRRNHDHRRRMQPPRLGACATRPSRSCPAGSRPARAESIGSRPSSCQGFDPALGLGHGVARRLKRPGERTPHVSLVVDEKDVHQRLHRFPGSVLATCQRTFPGPMHRVSTAASAPRWDWGCGC